MKRVTIYTTDENFSHFIELAKNLEYVKKIETDENSDEIILANIEAGLKEIALYKKGKLKLTSAKDFLNEI
ncbi:hypothetical protein MM213_14795 [Belliella sp. R4-6]|uniref:Uncharacterized protein n=1 Tax=Belliella alkalica TaxID=1730871 RepID=A0ABS9VEA5_9BACT|nr:hypothetical protein [Belliella alkalica]MCH7414766.1 hypothetical protein [Belliella alkalica]